MSIFKKHALYEGFFYRIFFSGCIRWTNSTEVISESGRGPKSKKRGSLMEKGEGVALLKPCFIMDTFIEVTEILKSVVFQSTKQNLTCC